MHFLMCLMFNSILSPRASPGATNHDMLRDTSILRQPTKKKKKKKKKMSKLKFK